MSKHTPGPWTFYADLPSTEPGWHIVTSENRQRVVANIHIEPGSAMDAANARLIAAAPELLEALTFIRDACHRLLIAGNGRMTADELDDIQSNAEAVIAKAEGTP